MKAPVAFVVFAACLLSDAMPASAEEMPSPARASALAAQTLMTDVALAGARIVAVGERGHIVYSDDGGGRWQQAVVPVSSLLTAVCFADDQYGFAVGHDGVLLATRDAGSTWALQRRELFDPDAYDAALDDAALDDAAPDDAALDDGMAYDEAAWQDDGGDMGASVSRKGAPLLDIWCRDRQHAYAVGAYGLLLQTSDGGAVWEDISARLPNPDGWHVNAITALPDAPDMLVLVGERGTVYRSTDAGNRFSALGAPGEGSLFGVLAPGGNTLLAFGLQGRLYRSEDAGSHWEEILTGISSGLNDGVVLPGGGVVLAGNAGVLLMSGSTLAQWQTVRREDRKAVLSIVPTENGLAIVGEGGARHVDAHGQDR